MSAIEALRSALGDEVEAEFDLVPFLRAADGDVAQAAVRWRNAREARKEYSKLTIKDVAEFYRTPQKARTHPDGCIFPLEDMKGGIARDLRRRPVLVAIGMQHGTAEEMQRQLAYVSELLEAHRLPHDPVHGACVVIEVRPRDDDAPPTFRFPDRAVRTLFDMQRDTYPASLFSTNHFCGLPRAVTWAFKLVRPFMRREAYESMVLKPSFAHLGGAMPKSSMLMRWGGELAFDLDAWVEWRASQEGVPVDELCPRGGGRMFDPKAAAATEDAMSDALGSSHIHVSARALLAGKVGGEGKPPLMHGVVEKRGSGRGLFGSVRWKQKLLMVSEIGLVYFDGLDAASDANKAARIMPLEEGTAVERRDSGFTWASEQHWFALVTPAREYLFRTLTAEDADGWVAAIAAELAAARKQRDAMSKALPDEPVEAAEELREGTPLTAAALDRLEIS